MDLKFKELKMLCDQYDSEFGSWPESKNKLIIAPNQEIPTGEGIWGFKGLVPEDWVLVS